MLADYQRYQEGLVKSLLTYPDAISDVLRMVSPNDFEDEKFKALYESMIELDYRSDKITLPGLLREMQRNHEEVTIAPEWVLSLDSNISSWVLQGPPQTWAELVKNESTRYKLEKLFEKQAKILSETTSTAEVLGELAAEFEEIQISAADNMLKSPSESIDEYYEYLDSLNTDATEAIPSPYPTVDYYVGGWKPRALITVGARTGVGKTVFAVQSALSAIHLNKTVLYFSLEMSRNELITRLGGAKSLVDIKKIEDGKIDEDENARLRAACEEIRKMPIYIDDTAEQTIDYISSTAIKQSRSKQLDMIIIDYLQLITPGRIKGRSRQEEVADISRKLKILAKKLGVPVMVLVQLKRAQDGEDEDRLPKLDDIRESGAIGQDSDVVMLIHRPHNNEDTIDPEATFIIDKNRKGPAGKYFAVSCMLQYGMFWDKKSEPLDLIPTETKVIEPQIITTEDIQAALQELPDWGEEIDPFDEDFDFDNNTEDY